MSDAMFEVSAGGGSGLAGEPQCMSSPLQSPTDDISDPTARMTLKSDDSGILMDESAFNDTLNDSATASPLEMDSPVIEEKRPLTNGHVSSDEEVVEDVIQSTESEKVECSVAVNDLISAMDGDDANIPEITIDSPETSVSIQEEDPETTTQNGTQDTTDTDVEQKDETTVVAQECEGVENEQEEIRVEGVNETEINETKGEEEAVAETQKDVDEVVDETEVKAEEATEEKTDEQAEEKADEQAEEKADEHAEGKADEQAEEKVDEPLEKTEENADEKEESSEEESEEEEEEEDTRVEFVREKGTPGRKCDDVWQALEILNTTYKVGPMRPSRANKAYHTLPRSKAQEKKPKKVARSATERRPKSSTLVRDSIITWSSWNITDMVHPLPIRNSVWFKDLPKKDDEEDVQESDENSNIKNLNTSISDKEKEIANLLEKVLEDDKNKKEQEDRLKEPEVPEATKEAPASPIEEDKVEPVQEAPIEAAPAPSTEQTPKEKKKKKGNIFQRMARNIRKRFGGERRSKA